MATITASLVNELRQKTGAGMMDCKKALMESGGDIEKAIDILRKKGQKVSELRAGKASNEGLVIARTTDDGKKGYVIHLSSETDFVAKNEEFVRFADTIVEAALKNDPASLDELLTLRIDGLTIKDKLTELIGKINENIQLAKYQSLSGECVVAYNHSNGKIGVLVALNKPCNEKINEIGKDLAMQIAAMNPVAIDSDDVPQEIVERELAIGREQAIAEGKPENIIDRIAQGKLQKFFKENTLLNQQFVKDNSKTVAQVLKEVDPELKVTGFVRVAAGG